MARLFYMVGKSSTGKDTIYSEVLGQPDLELNPLVMYSTRRIREGETDGKEYHFAQYPPLEESSALRAAQLLCEMGISASVGGGE